MTAVQSQLTLEAARNRRDAGIVLSSENAGEEWSIEAKDFLKRYLEKNSTMHVDLLWDAGLPEPVSARGLGAVIKYAIKQNWIRHITDDNGYIAALPSKRSNMTIKPVWHSNLYIPDNINNRQTA